VTSSIVADSASLCIAGGAVDLPAAANLRALASAATAQAVA